MAMKISNSVLLGAIVALVVLLTLPLAVAQDERIQESVTSSDDRIDFTKSKAAPSKIESVFYQKLLVEQKQYKSECEQLAKLKRDAKKRADKAGRRNFLAKDQQYIRDARARVENARERVREAERKANAD
jgi:hypothetical protein